MKQLIAGTTFAVLATGLFFSFAFGHMMYSVMIHLIAGLIAFCAMSKFSFKRWSLAHTGILTVCLIFGIISLLVIGVTDMREKYMREK